MNKPILDGKRVKRCYELSEARVSQDGNTVEGHAAVYGQTTDIGGWYNERIAQGAFDNADISDVALYLNHNTSALPLARARRSIPNSSMKVTPDFKGLYMTATLDAENNTDARALISAITRKDITGMSFAFIVGDEAWAGLDTDVPMRTINTIAKVFEVSAVTNPAYSDTDINARSDSLESDRAALERARKDMSKNDLVKRKINIERKYKK